MLENNKLKASKLGIVTTSILTPIIVYMLDICLPKLPYSQMSMDAFWANKIANSKKYDIIFIGDSRIYRGVNPSIVSQITSSKTLNYGFSGAGLDSTLIFSGIKQLDKEGKKMIVFGITPSSFTEEASKNEHLKTLEKISSKDLWIRKNIYPYLSFFDSYSLSEIKKAIKHESYSQECQADGFIYSNKFPTDSFASVQDYTAYFKRTPINELQQTKFINILKQLHSSGIKCYAFRVPISSPISALESQYFDFDVFKTKLEDVGARWISIPQNGFISYDGSHLNGPSANKLSSILGDSILKYH